MEVTIWKQRIDLNGSMTIVPQWGPHWFVPVWVNKCELRNTEEIQQL